MQKFEYETGEVEIGNWTLLYEPPGGGHFNGKLYVTNEKLYYDSKFNISLAGIIETSLFKKTNKEGYILIPKSRIKSVIPQKSMFKKKILIELDNGEMHTFDYGMLNIDKIVDAINSQ
ncbi:MAG TPA: hypothetical protein PK447_04825 [Ignavibacteria bacterium]|nr:hypothetical protein [Ignavibacteria bacterium]